VLLGAGGQRRCAAGRAPRRRQGCRRASGRTPRLDGTADVLDDVVDIGTVLVDAADADDADDANAPLVGVLVADVAVAPPGDVAPLAATG